jgi:hypothetical protein
MDQQGMEQHGEHRGLKSFVIACLILIAITALSMYAIVQIAARFPAALPWKIEAKVTGKALPADIPLYKGAVLKESTVNGNRSTFKYMLPLGAETTVRTFYEAEMPKNNWARLAGDENFLEFFKEEGKRRVMIRINYENGKASVAFEIYSAA